MPLEQRHDHHLGEQAAPGLLEHVPAGTQFEGVGLAELHADHQATTADVGQHLVAARRLLQHLRYRRAGPLGVADKLLVLDDGERGEPGCHRGRVGPERAVVHHDPVH